jgi:hypothetical protein
LQRAWAGRSPAVARMRSAAGLAAEFGVQIVA